MMKSFVYTFLLVFTAIFSTAQQLTPNSIQHEQTPTDYRPRDLYIGKLDSLRYEISTTSNDTMRMDLANILWEYYIEVKPDSALYFGEQHLILAKKLNLKLDEAVALNTIGIALTFIGNYPRALQTLLLALDIAEDPKSEKNILPAKYLDRGNFPKNVSSENIRLSALALTHLALGNVYEEIGNYQKQLFHNFQTKQLAEQINNQFLLCLVYMNLGSAYSSPELLDSALLFEQKAYNLSLKYGFKRYVSSILVEIGRIQFKKGNKFLAKKYFHRAANANAANNNTVTDSYLSLANLYLQSGEKDSSLYYAKKGFVAAKEAGVPRFILSADTILSAVYKLRNNIDSAFKYQEMSIKIRDSLFNEQKVQQFQNIGFDEQLRRQQLETAEATFRNRLRMYSLLAALGIILLVALILWRNNRQRKSANTLLQQQKKEIQINLIELKSTQALLIQSEKMASLGELTAGIAHEIQNPLNFVNNFSEVSKELLGEMDEEIDNGNIEQLKVISEDVKQNIDKILYHGKRADAIVKGMLQHSRSSTGQKEATNINALADEYLRLAYHGLRAKNKSFNATIKTDFDESIGKINIIPQDIGRVILNLITNAFYAVTEKKEQKPEEYEPSILVSTKKMDDKVLISVKDNGNGISEKILDKIFQPFFTTKPTGQGTGLGLSLAYDIVKAHGGNIVVSSEEGTGAEFRIEIPKLH